MFERIILVRKPTALEELLSRHYSRRQARFYLERRGASFKEYEAAHAAYCSVFERIIAALPRNIPHDTVSRELVASFLFRPSDLAVAVGPDGLVANIAKYLRAGQPILAVNPDPKRIDGILMRHEPESAIAVLPRICAGEFKCDSLTLAKAKTNDGQELYAVNDLLAGRRDQISSRYILSFGGRSERQSSSGVLISTGVGSTGWMSSVMNGAARLCGGNGGERVPFGWDEPRLLFAVREPFISRYTGAEIVSGWVSAENELVIESEMPEGGVIFSDGVPEDALEFNSGAIVKIGLAEFSARLIAP